MAPEKAISIRKLVSVSRHRMCMIPRPLVGSESLRIGSIQMDTEPKDDVNILEWLEQWYLHHCDGDWEHQFGIVIDTLDNPGWMVRVDLECTELASKPFDIVRVDRSQHNWVMCQVVNEQFQGAGGPSNLVELLEIFRDWVSA
jgi:hypothetical protein